jgi:hypothetical protein
MAILRCAITTMCAVEVLLSCGPLDKEHLSLRLNAQKKHPSGDPAFRWFFACFGLSSSEPVNCRGQKKRIEKRRLHRGGLQHGVPCRQETIPRRTF